MFSGSMEALLVLGLFGFVVLGYLARNAIKPGGFIENLWRGKK